MKGFAEFVKTCILGGFLGVLPVLLAIFVLVETVDLLGAVTEPLVAREFDITSEYGTVVLRSGDDTQRLESRFDEESILNALIRLTSGTEHIVCFTEGHEEIDPDDPLPGLARRIAGCPLGDSTARRLETAERLAEDYRVDGVVHHAFHLADMYLTREAAAYAVTQLRPTSIDPSGPRETSGPRTDRTSSSA